MNQLLVVALALCALPCALGRSCYSCTPNVTLSRACNMMSDLMMMNCSTANATCAQTSIMSSALPSVTFYAFMCAELGDCTNTNTTVCQETINAGNGTITSCSTSCCDSDNCNMPPVMPSSTAVMPSSTVGPTGPGSTTPSAGDKLRPILGLLFVVLFTLV